MKDNKLRLIMNMTASEVKAMVAGFYRYKKQCPVVAFEASDWARFRAGEPADVLAVTESRMLYEIEVKISLSDMKNDKKKRKHYHFMNTTDYIPVHQFYFAVPKELVSKALEICKEYYPYAGLLSVSKFPFNSAAIDFGVHCEHRAKVISNERLTIKQVMYLVIEQSGTLCRLARDRAIAEKAYKIEQIENRKLNKALILAGVTA